MAGGWRVAVLTDEPPSSRDIQETLRSPFQPTLLSVERISDVAWSDFDAFVIDAWRMGPDEMARLADMIAVLSHQGGPVGVVIGGPMRARLGGLMPLADLPTFQRPIAAPTWTACSRGRSPAAPRRRRRGRPRARPSSTRPIMRRRCAPPTTHWT